MKKEPEKVMEQYWGKISNTYGEAVDLEEKVRSMIKEFIMTLPSSSSIFELGCGNGKVLKKLIGTKRLIAGADSSEEMISVAKSLIPNSVTFIHEDIKQSLGREEKWDVVFCCNTLHNFKNKKEIEWAIKNIKNLVDSEGFIIIDIRNMFNPFISYGYAKSRKQGLQFFTFSFLKAKRILKNAGFKNIKITPVFYSSLEEAGKNKKSIFYRFFYRVWIFFTKFIFFAPYIIIFAQKK